MENVKAPPPRTMPPIEHMRSQIAKSVAEASIQVATLVEQRQVIRDNLRRLDRDAEKARADLDEINATLDVARKALVDAIEDVT